MSSLYVPVHVLFYGATIGIGIFLMNLLIGILGSNYERYEEKSRQLFVRERATLIIGLSSRPWVNYFWRKADWRTGYLCFAVRTVPNADEERSIAGKIQVKLESLEERQNAKMAKLELQIQVQYADLSAKMDSV